MLKRPYPDRVDNPVSDHIKPVFKMVGDFEGMISEIADDLIKSLDPEKSRVLIFVPSRKGTEQVVEDLNEKFEAENPPLYNKVDFYHAGLDGASRDEKYHDYKEGKTLILAATKAFGMGMDIPNIHFLFHMGPSSTFEDFLQEVGRAGRNKKTREAAGFSESNPIVAKCLVTNKSFKDQKDRQHDSQITWTHINEVRKTVFEYLSRFRPLEPNNEKAFPLPLDLLEQFVQFEDVRNRETFFRVALYWLEKLKRIRLGVFTPTHLPISLLEGNGNFRNIKKSEDREQLEKLVKSLISYQKKIPEAETLMVETSRLREFCSVRTVYDIYKILFRAQKAELIRIEREIKLAPTQLRMHELNSWRRNVFSPTLECAFGLSERLLEESKTGDQVSLEGKYIDELIQALISNYINPSEVFWKQSKNDKEEFSKEDIAFKLKDDFTTKRYKSAFKILGFAPKIKSKSVIEIDKGEKKPRIIQLIYNGNKNKKTSKEYLQEFKKDLITLIYLVSQKYIKENSSTFNIVDLLIELGIEDKGEEYFQQLIFIAKGLGYIKGGGSLLPMGVELFIDDISDFNDEELNSEDAKVKEEFMESNKMRELRLLALECLSEISPAAHDRFIRNYFECEELKSLVSLLEENLSENHSGLVAFRTEALEKEETKLNEDQRNVYFAPIDQNLQVIAGPGSGKTHTLILRVARLIQVEKVQPENILVLAYNRAVVVELKDRLGRLFKDLGYSKLIKRLKVFTFHGFIKYCLGNKLEDLDFKDWTPKFLEITQNSPGLISQKLGYIKHVCVDEFQDITEERMDLLKHIANPSSSNICVIGDPNQSIYGYEKANAGGPMNPQPYYETFASIYKPVELNLSINYRSYSEIITEAENFLSRNETRFDIPDLTAFKTSGKEENIVEVIDSTERRGIRWEDYVQNLVTSTDNNIKTYQQIAVMFRSNDEVFRAFNILKRMNLGCRLRIQGSKGALYKTREFYFFLSYLKQQENNPLPKNFVQLINQEKEAVLRKHPNWDEYLLNIFHCLAFEFQKEADDDSTFGDLANFVKDIAGKDDGQFGKIYQQNIGEIREGDPEQELIVTTMHKVKGIEYDAVIIPPSIANLAINVGDNVQDYIEEERRLYYVAYTRAKHKLVVLKYHREIALDNGEPYQYPKLRNFRIKVDEGADKFTMYWSASVYGRGSFEFIRDNVKIGDEVTLKSFQRGNFRFWEAVVGNRSVASVSLAMSQKINHLPEVTGFVVSSIYVNTYEETFYSDTKNGTTYAENWTQESIDRGFIYLIDFSGYAS